MNAVNKNTPSMHHSRKRKVTTSIVGLKNSHLRKTSQKKKLNPRDIAGNAEEEEEEEDEEEEEASNYTTVLTLKKLLFLLSEKSPLAGMWVRVCQSALPNKRSRAHSKFWKTNKQQ